MHIILYYIILYYMMITLHCALLYILCILTTQKRTAKLKELDPWLTIPCCSVSKLIL